MLVEKCEELVFWTGNRPRKVGLSFGLNSSLCELRRSGSIRPGSPAVYMPDQPSRLVVSEVSQLEAALPPDVAALDNLRSEVNAPWRSIDAGALHHIRHTTLRQEEKAQRHFALTISLCVIVLCLVECS
jgi:hypothetical protein